MAKREIKFVRDWCFKRWLTADEASEYLGMSRQTFWRQCRKLFVPSGITSRPLYDRNDLDSFLEQRKNDISI